MNAREELRKVRAALVAEWDLRKRFERIEWEEQTLKPALEQAAKELGTGTLTTYELEA